MGSSESSALKGRIGPYLKSCIVLVPSPNVNTAPKMYTYFHFNTDVIILFHPWHVNNDWQMLVSCLVVCVMAFTYEGIKVLRHCLLKKMVTNEKVTTTEHETSTEKQAIIPKDRSPTMAEVMCSVHHVLQTALHLIQMTLAYSLMLLVMTYNAWLAITVLFGLVLGYFVFGWRNYSIVSIVE